ncbi:MAG: hypothetical protein IJ688_13010 [Treponema sp.]|nr:hypothetical protein [Treponema sp.]
MVKEVVKKLEEKNAEFNDKKNLWIPIISVLVIIGSFIIASILEFPTNRGAIYSFFAGVAIFGIFLIPIPCLIISVIGTVKAASIKNDKYKIIGIVEIIFSALGILLEIYIFTIGQSV